MRNQIEKFCTLSALVLNVFCVMEIKRTAWKQPQIIWSKFVWSLVHCITADRTEWKTVKWVKRVCLQLVQEASFKRKLWQTESSVCSGGICLEDELSSNAYLNYHNYNIKQNLCKHTHCAALSTFTQVTYSLHKRVIRDSESRMTDGDLWPDLSLAARQFSLSLLKNVNKSFCS